MGEPQKALLRSCHLNKDLKKMRKDDIEVTEGSLFEKGSNHQNIWGESIPASRLTWLERCRQRRSERNCEWQSLLV